MSDTTSTIATTIEQRADQIAEDFSFLDGWEERYTHIITMGRALKPMPEALMTDATKVHGCASQVWMYGQKKGKTYTLQAASDASIVSGLIAILISLYNNANVEEAKSFDITSYLNKIGLSAALSAQRANGLNAMIKQIEQHLHA